MPSFLKDAKRWLPGAIISIALIAAILYFVDIPKVVAAIRAADYRILAWRRPVFCLDVCACHCLADIVAGPRLVPRCPACPSAKGIC